MYAFAARDPFTSRAGFPRFAARAGLPRFAARAGFALRFRRTPELVAELVRRIPPNVASDRRLAAVCCAVPARPFGGIPSLYTLIISPPVVSAPSATMRQAVCRGLGVHRRPVPSLSSRGSLAFLRGYGVASGSILHS